MSWGAKYTTKYLTEGLRGSLWVNDGLISTFQALQYIHWPSYKSVSPKCYKRQTTDMWSVSPTARMCSLCQRTAGMTRGVLPALARHRQRENEMSLELGQRDRRRGRTQSWDVAAGGLCLRGQTSVRDRDGHFEREEEETRERERREERQEEKRRKGRTAAANFGNAINLTDSSEAGRITDKLFGA